MVKVLFDQGTPVGLRKHLWPYEIDTLAEKGWSRRKNGEMLDLAERSGYGTLVTTDGHLEHEQNLRGRQIAIVVLLRAKWPKVATRAEKIDEAIRTTGPGEVTRVECGDEDGGKKGGQEKNKERQARRSGRER